MNINKVPKDDGKHFKVKSLTRNYDLSLEQGFLPVMFSALCLGIAPGGINLLKAPDGKRRRLSKSVIKDHRLTTSVQKGLLGFKAGYGKWVLPRNLTVCIRFLLYKGL